MQSRIQIFARVVSDKTHVFIQYCVRYYFFSFIIPRLWNREGDIEMALSVLPSVRPSFRPSFLPSVRPSPWHINTFGCIYIFIYTLCMWDVCRANYDRLCPEMISWPSLISSPLAYPVCYLYAQSHARDIDTPSYMIMLTGESACTRQTNTRTAVHRDPHVTMWHYLSVLIKKIKKKTTYLLKHGTPRHTPKRMKILYSILYNNSIWNT